MRKRNNPISYLVIAVFFLALSMIMVYASAANAASNDVVVLKAGECVIETIDGDMYVGKNMKFSTYENFITMSGVRYPDGILGVAIPIKEIKNMYTVSE